MAAASLVTAHTVPHSILFTAFTRRIVFSVYLAGERQLQLIIIIIIITAAAAYSHCDQHNTSKCALPFMFNLFEECARGVRCVQLGEWPVRVSKRQYLGIM